MTDSNEENAGRPEPDGWLYSFMNEEKATLEKADFQVSQEEQPLWSGETIRKAIEERWKDVDNYKVETKFEKEAKEIVRNQLKQLLIDFGIVEREVSINGITLEEVFSGDEL
jgi:hypothetical protein